MNLDYNSRRGKYLIEAATNQNENSRGKPMLHIYTTIGQQCRAKLRFSANFCMRKVKRNTRWKEQPNFNFIL